MISPSPEFPITKPGMHLQRKRDKPLRTYGRRQPPTVDARTEPPAKRRKFTDERPKAEDGNTAERDAAPAAGPTTGHGQSERDLGAPTPAKDSILNYFKRQPPAVVAKSSGSSGGTCPEGPSAAPPSPSPITNRKRRAPRLLRIRPAVLPEIGEDGHHDDENHSDDSEKENQGQARKDKGTRKRLQPRAEKTPASSEDNASRCIIDLAPQKQQQQQQHRKPVATQAKPRTRHPPTVQTTLNLSSRPAFDECTVCNTVWNPLCPDDARYHSRRHATVVRRERDRQKREGKDERGEE
ncbi:hypothetical protein ACRE_008510 [Hapsidospora chrysogenum ATCC 11550]|uniref:Uncharacterized protein n=1 Tax=Hapsidospora chrysogenum (strain ATCC 11550 / CBS 779.69 / DSM 880 / IAM 14645 / JCM 23072 / IMI 49137) TaxID=857340 RepID=A0A086TFX7_HAPC1|nr:hypothetical protein ACRE_008510 [Hapsidospora chrysogenum ATCC 11550]